MTEATFTKLRTSAAFDVVSAVLADLDRVYGWIQRLTAQSQPSIVDLVHQCTQLVLDSVLHR